MRTSFFVLLILFATCSGAQTLLPAGIQSNLYDTGLMYNRNLHDSTATKPWFISSYHGISAGYNFFNGGGANFFAAPMGLQLNRRLTGNLYAFAGITVIPVYGNFNSNFINTDINKTNGLNSFYRPGNFSMYSAATMGLMYINNDKTFSVSGSLSVERGGYPLYYNNRANQPVQQHNPSNR